ncbi:histone H1-I-like [Olea europaea subsp. europaea]|uniref:Histone H1-I-like n=1 Tax=Olea europaea subsp. europaea TaxID=158383 RepID=A0A8S0UKL3_OLEEU|nr:histone H1-I-like [Olea europaea subsp. europaea]
MAKFQEVIAKLAETHPNAPLTAASKSILQDRMSQLLSQSQTPDHPPYAAMIERALQELNEKWGSSEDSMSKFIKKEYKNLPWAHSTLLKHHLGKLRESGEVVTRGQRYMLAGAIPYLNSSTRHKRKTRKKKWKLNWDWKRERYKPCKRRESKQKNQQKGDQDEVTEDQKESEGLENHLSENAMYGEEKQKEEDKEERLLSSNIRESNDDFDPSLLSTEPPSNMEFYEYKYLEKVKPQQQEGDKAEDNCPELSSQRPPDFESIRVEPTSRMELAENKYLEMTKPQLQEVDKTKDNGPELSSQRPPDFESIRVENSSQLGIYSVGDFGAQECPIVTKKLHLLESSSERLDSAEGVKLELNDMEHSITQKPLIVGPLKNRSVGPTGLELVSSKEFCQSLRNHRLPEPETAATMRYMEVLAFSKSEDQHSPQLKLSNLECVQDQQKTPKNSTTFTDQRAKLRSYRKQHEPEQFNLSKSDGKEVVWSFVNETYKLGAKKRDRRRKTMS